jgi:hypothetical protein
MKVVHVVGCRTGEAGAPETHPIRLWSAQDDAAVGLGSVCVAIRQLLVDAAKCPDTLFRLDEDAFTGRFGLDARHYAEMFRIRPENVEVPPSWDALYGRVSASGRMRLIIAGSRCFDDYAFLAGRLTRLCKRFPPERILGISGGARGADQLGERWCLENGIEVVRFDAHWEWIDAPRAIPGERKGAFYNRRAGADRNAKMAVAGTHLAAFAQGATLTPGTRSMVQLARSMGLAVRAARAADGSETSAQDRSDG